MTNAALHLQGITGFANERKQALKRAGKRHFLLEGVFTDNG
jgi:hypothetical protein